MPPTFKGVLLDIDNTLYDYNTAHAVALEKTMAFFRDRTELPEEQLKTAYREARKSINTDLADTAASHHRLLYFQRMCELLSLKPFRVAVPAYDMYWGTFLKAMTLRPQVSEFLHLIADRKKAIVTDLTAHIQFEKIQILNLDPHIDFLVSSEEAGREKPHAPIFELALRKLELEPQDVCMIGDNYAKDICGAAQLGIQPFWLNTEAESLEKPVPGMIEFKHFSELWTYFDDGTASLN